RRAVVALLLPLGRDVNRVVIHHAARDALGVRDRGVVHLVGSEHRAGAEVVPQAERVPDLVHHRLLDGLAEELLGELGLLLLLLLVLFLILGLVPLLGGRAGRIVGACKGQGGEADLVGLGAGIVAGGDAAPREALLELGL